MIDPKTIKVTQKTAYPNQFGAVRENGLIDWHSCRDGFRSSYTKETEFFFFSCPTNEQNNVIAFLNRFEKQVKVRKPENKCKIHNSDVENILIIEPGPWWNSLHVRRQMLTIVLRAGRAYSAQHDNFQDCLNSSPYLSKTPGATKLFLQGNTFCNKKQMNKGSGWVEFFAGRNGAQAAQVLVKPPRHQKKLAEVPAPNA
jgi:hypothetical protein